MALDKRGRRPHPDAVTLGAALRAERDGANLTQQALADLADLRQPDLSHWESGNREPSLSELVRIERALRLRLGTILTRAGYVEQTDRPEDLIAQDPRLDPVFRDVAVDNYLSFVKRSTAATSESPTTPRRAKR